MSVQPPQVPSTATAAPTWKQGFWRRLGIYLFGFALGCMLLVVIQMVRNANVKNATAAPVPVPAVPAAPAK